MTENLYYFVFLVALSQRLQTVSNVTNPNPVNRYTINGHFITDNSIELLCNSGLVEYNKHNTEGRKTFVLFIYYVIIEMI